MILGRGRGVHSFMGGNDMAHAPTAASDYNSEHGLKPIAYMDRNAPGLSFSLSFLVVPFFNQMTNK